MSDPESQVIGLIANHRLSWGTASFDTLDSEVTAWLPVPPTPSAMRFREYVDGVGQAQESDADRQRLAAAEERIALFAGQLTVEIGLKIAGGERSGERLWAAAKGAIERLRLGDSWQVKREILERRLAGRMQAAQALDRLCALLAVRLAKPRPRTAATLSLSASDGQLAVRIDAHGAITQPVVFITVQKRHDDAQVKLQALFGTVALPLLLNLDLGKIDPAGEATRLAAISAEIAAMPVHLVLPGPDLRAGQAGVITLKMPAEWGDTIERVDARLLSREGACALETLSGMDAAVHLALEQRNRR